MIGARHPQQGRHLGVLVQDRLHRDTAQASALDFQIIGLILVKADRHADEYQAK